MKTGLHNICWKFWPIELEPVCFVSHSKRNKKNLLVYTSSFIAFIQSATKTYRCVHLRSLDSPPSPPQALIKDSERCLVELPACSLSLSVQGSLKQRSNLSAHQEPHWLLSASPMKPRLPNLVLSPCHAGPTPLTQTAPSLTGRR